MSAHTGNTWRSPEKRSWRILLASSSRRSTSLEKEKWCRSKSSERNSNYTRSMMTSDTVDAWPLSCQLSRDRLVLVVGGGRARDPRPKHAVLVVEVAARRAHHMADSDAP